MKITYHHRTLGDGAEGVHIAEIVRALRRDGHDVDLVSLVGETTTTRAPSPRAAWIAAVRRALPRAVSEVAEVGYGLAAGARLVRRMRARRPDFLYERYGLANLAGAIASRALAAPLILEVNAPIALERERDAHERGLVFARTLARLERAVFRAADRAVVVSTPLADHLASVGVARERLVVLPNGADPKRFDPAAGGAAVRARHGCGTRLVVGFVGVVRRWHGLELLARAFAKAAPAEAILLVVGDGPACGELMDEARALGIADRVRITGRVAHEAIPDHIAAMDVAASPRATFYASPMKIPEYMAGGRAVVAPRMANIEDLVADGRTGLLFEPEDVDSLSAALKSVLEDAALRKRLAESGRREVETRLNWAANARKIVSVAAELIDARGVRLLGAEQRRAA